MTTEEKLAVAITALKVISGDPVNDEAYLKVTGQDKIDASMRISRKALAALNVDMSAPCSMDQLQRLM